MVVFERREDGQTEDGQTEEGQTDVEVEIVNNFFIDVFYEQVEK